MERVFGHLSEYLESKTGRVSKMTQRPGLEGRRVAGRRCALPLRAPEGVPRGLLEEEPLRRPLASRRRVRDSTLGG